MLAILARRARQAAPRALMGCLLLSGLLVAARPLAAQCSPPDMSGVGGSGPDVIVGVIENFVESYGSAGGFHAYSVGTVSCNIGTQNLQWVASNSNHPVIAQNLYRLRNGRFEQVGLSWLKHGFLALADNDCGCGCQNPGNGSLLGVGCSDPYGAGLNGSQGSLGARSEVHSPHAGGFTYPRVLNPPIQDVTSTRLRVATPDVDPAQNAGAQYVIECQYVTPDDAAAGNAYNNCSYRRCSFGASPGTHPLSWIGQTVRQQPAIRLWQTLDPQVVLQDVFTGETPHPGRLIVGTRVYDNGNGTYDYEYAVYNQNSTRGVRTFELPLPAGIAVSQVGFHDADYHSGEMIQSTDWTASVGATSIVWSTQTFAQNQFANALRWGSLYNFRFRANAPPTSAQLTLGLFRNAGFNPPDAVTTSVLAPSGDFVLPVANLQCTASGTDVTLLWTLGDAYSEIQVRRSGTLIATLAGTATSHVDAGVPVASHFYQVTGLDGVSASIPTSCSVQVLPPPTLIFTYTADSLVAAYDLDSGSGTFAAAVRCHESPGNPDFPNDTAGFSVALTCDPTLLEPTGLVLGAAFQVMDGGTGPDFFLPYVLPGGVAAGVVYSFMNDLYLTFLAPTELFNVTYQTLPALLAGNPAGAVTLLSFVDGVLANPPVDNVVATPLAGPRPLFVHGTVTLEAATSATFRRGDCNGDSVFDIADAITVLGFLFPGPTPPTLGCPDACDGNDDGALDIADAIRLLSALFGNPTVPLPMPYGVCGSDPQGDADGLACPTYAPCP